MTKEPLQVITEPEHVQLLACGTPIGVDTLKDSRHRRVADGSDVHGGGGRGDELA